MVNTQNPNIELLMLAVNQLGDLVDEMVFVGGCATSLLITDTAAPPIRATKDVDAIVQVATKADYYKLSERLRLHGFVEDTSEDAPLCRWVTNNVMLDVMPTEADILGFGNKWYAAAMDGRPALVEEVRQSEPALVDELATRFQELLEDQQFVDSVPGHMPTDEVSQSRAEKIFNTIKKISDKK